MRLPSKVTPFRRSILFKFPAVIKVLKQGDICPGDLFQRVKRNGIDMADFIEILDGLYLLGRIDFLSGKGVLHYVEENSV